MEWARSGTPLLRGPKPLLWIAAAALLLLSSLGCAQQGHRLDRQSFASDAPQWVSGESLIYVVTHSSQGIHKVGRDFNRSIASWQEHRVVDLSGNDSRLFRGEVLHHDGSRTPLVWPQGIDAAGLARPVACVANPNRPWVAFIFDRGWSFEFLVYDFTAKRTLLRTTYDRLTRRKHGYRRFMKAVWSDDGANLFFHGRLRYPDGAVEDACLLIATSTGKVQALKVPLPPRFDIDTKVRWLAPGNVVYSDALVFSIATGKMRAATVDEKRAWASEKEALLGLLEKCKAAGSFMHTQQGVMSPDGEYLSFKGVRKGDGGFARVLGVYQPRTGNVRVLRAFGPRK